MKFLIYGLFLLSMPVVSFSENNCFDKDCDKEHFRPERSHKKHDKRDKRKVNFNTSFIFNFDQKFQDTRDNADLLKKEFKDQLEITQRDIEYYEKKLEFLIQDRKSNTNQTAELVETLNKLYELSDQQYKLIKTHSASMMKMVDDSYAQYESNIKSMLKTAETNSQAVIDDLMKRYDEFHNKKKKK